MALSTQGAIAPAHDWFTEWLRETEAPMMEHSREELAALIAFHGDELVMGIALEQPREDVNRRAERVGELVNQFLGRGRYADDR